MDEDFFWGDLLAHIRRQVLVPVVGPDLALVNVEGREQTFTSLIGQRLVEQYRLSGSPEVATTGEAVALILAKCGRDEVDRLYRVIYDIISDVDPAPGDALRDLAAIDDLHLFVSTTPDRLLAKALNEVRFQGRPQTRELMFAPNQSTNQQSKNNAQAADSTDTVVLNLFGQAVPIPQYAIHDEDLLEWLCALLSEAASFPDWLSAPLRQRPTLFIGYEIPDWIGRYLLRMSSGDTRLSQRNQQFFFVGSSSSHESPLSTFLRTFCRSTLVQHLDMEPTKFVAQLRERWEKQSSPKPPVAEHLSPTPAPPAPEAPSIFISYMREDADAARRLRDEITKLGGDVWLDEGRLLPGDTWEPEILNSIRGTVKLFVPVISANTEREDEGYVFREWRAAAERALAIMGRRFIVPVVIDEDYDGDPSRFRRIPPDFINLNFGRAPGGAPDAGLLEMLTREIRAMRRTDAARTP